MSLSDAMKIAHSIKKYVKDMTSPNYPTAEQSVMMVSEEVSAMIQGETPTKRPDPGSFVLIAIYRTHVFLDHYVILALASILCLTPSQ